MRLLLRTFDESVIQHHLHELEQVRYAAEHAGAPHGEELAQYPGAFVVDFTLDFAIAESADFCGRDFRFFDFVEVACERVPAAAGHAERFEESFAPLLLQIFPCDAAENHSQKNARRVAIVEVGAWRMLELVRIKRVQDSFGRERTERLHRHAVIEAVREQVENAYVVAVICLQFRDVVNDLVVDVERTFQDVTQRKCGGGTDLRERGDVENGIFGGVERHQTLGAVGQDESCDCLAEYAFFLGAV